MLRYLIVGNVTGYALENVPKISIQFVCDTSDNYNVKF
jgi:hypothetical protein